MEDKKWNKIGADGPDNSQGSKKERPEKRPEKNRVTKVTEGYIERAALHYLGRFSSSESNLVKVLERKVRRRNEEHAPVTDEQQQWIISVVAKCVRFGYVDDAQYAKQRAAGLLRKGKPVRIILQDLKFKGVAEDLASDVINNLSGDDDIEPDKRAAAAYVKRRRFGPFRRVNDKLEEKREKEIASMMRAGFRYDLVKTTLDMSEDDIIDLLV
ncbi:regulatory protein RecX [Kordiimonas aquimaris]|uniref:regulatory protein RecX n=1 Tax=Kordiimonas aquimaris TaxID=707591 RepID=UPI0021D19E57|nr:RecX family transcriptional regulator [Kordiimonas aquimaris]